MNFKNNFQIKLKTFKFRVKGQSKPYFCEGYEEKQTLDFFISFYNKNNQKQISESDVKLEIASQFELNVLWGKKIDKSGDIYYYIKGIPMTLQEQKKQFYADESRRNVEQYFSNDKYKPLEYVKPDVYNKQNVMAFGEVPIIIFKENEKEPESLIPYYINEHEKLNSESLSSSYFKNPNMNCVIRNVESNLRVTDMHNQLVNSYSDVTNMDLINADKMFYQYSGQKDLYIGIENGEKCLFIKIQTPNGVIHKNIAKVKDMLEYGKLQNPHITKQQKVKNGKTRR